MAEYRYAYPPILGVPTPEIIAGTSGVATGLLANEFFAEWAARVSGQVEWGKVGVKAVVKLLLMAGFLGLSARVTGALTKLYLKVAGFTTGGTILWDIFMQLYPGGIWGAAEAAAIMARGGRVAAAKLGVTPARFPFPIGIQRAPAAVRFAPRVTVTAPATASASPSL